MQRDRALVDKDARSIAQPQRVGAIGLLRRWATSLGCRAALKLGAHPLTDRVSRVDPGVIEAAKVIGGYVLPAVNWS